MKLDDGLFSSACWDSADGIPTRGRTMLFGLGTDFGGGCFGGVGEGSPRTRTGTGGGDSITSGDCDTASDGDGAGPISIVLVSGAGVDGHALVGTFLSISLTFSRKMDSSGSPIAAHCGSRTSQDGARASIPKNE